MTDRECLLKVYNKLIDINFTYSCVRNQSRGLVNSELSRVINKIRNQLDKL